MRRLILGHIQLTKRALALFYIMLLSTPSYASSLQTFMQHEILTYLLVDLAFFLGIWGILGLLKYLCKHGGKPAKTTTAKTN